MRLTLLAGVFAAALAVPLSARAALDPYLPPDTQLFLSLDLRKAFDSDLFKTHVLGHARQALRAVASADEALKDLGLDPFRHINRIVLASPSAAEKDRGLAIVHGTFDTDKFKARADKLRKADSESVKIHEVPLGGGAKHDVCEIVVPGADLSLYIALASGKVLLASPGKDYVVDALKQAKAGRKPALKDKAVEALLEAIDDKLPVAVAVPGKALASVVGTELLPEKLLDGIDAVGGGLSIGEEIKLDLAITAKETDNARTVRDAAERYGKLGLGLLGVLSGEDSPPALDFAFDLLKSLKASGKGKVVRLSATIKAQTLRGLFR